MDDELLAAFLAGFTFARYGRTAAELRPLSRRTAESAFRRWHSHRSTADS